MTLRYLVHLRISFIVPVLRRARRADDRRIHDRAFGDLDAATMQMIVHRRQQHLAELVPLQEVSELAHRGLIRGPFEAQINAGKLTHRDRVVLHILARRGRHEIRGFCGSVSMDRPGRQKSQDQGARHTVAFPRCVQHCESGDVRAHFTSGYSTGG